MDPMCREHLSHLLGGGKTPMFHLSTFKLLPANPQAQPVTALDVFPFLASVVLSLHPLCFVPLL